MEAQSDSRSSSPPTYEPYANEKQPPPMMMQEEGAPVTYPNQPHIMYSGQPMGGQIIYPPQPMGAHMMYPPQLMGGQIIYPPQPIGGQMMYQPQPIGAQVEYPPQQVVINHPQYIPEKEHFKHLTLHYRVGIALICLGIITCIIDPLVPRILRYQHSILLAGIFMIISGATSISGSNEESRCHLVVSMVFDILASINLFGGLIAGIIIATAPFLIPQRIFGIFMAIYCPILFCVVVWDSSLKCGDTCCKHHPTRQLPTNPTQVYTVQAPAVIIK